MHPQVRPRDHYDLTHGNETPRDYFSPINGVKVDLAKLRLRLTPASNVHTRLESATHAGVVLRHPPQQKTNYYQAAEELNPLCIAHMQGLVRATQSLTMPFNVDWRIVHALTC